MRRTVAAVEDVFGPDHPHMATALENLAAALRRMGQPDEAARTDARALEIRNAALIGPPRAARPRRRVSVGPHAARHDIVPAVLDVAGAAQYLAVSADTMYGLVRSGDVPHVRVGKSIRFRPGDLDRFLDERASRQWERLDRRGRPRK